MDLTRHAEVFDRAAPTYDRVGVDFFTVVGRALVEAAALRPGGTVLDVGCGRGAVLVPAAGAVGPTGRAVGVDLAPAMVALTAADLADQPHVTVSQADAAALPPDMGTFDAVLSSLVLFFCDDPASVLRGWARHVAPGGRLGLVTFVDDGVPDWFRPLVQQHLPPPPEPTGPTPFELVRDPAWLDRALLDAGLPVIDAAVHAHDIVVRDVEQWWEWTWSHGARAALEQLDADQLDAVKAGAAAILDQQRLTDGRMGVRSSIRITIARR